jgi:hypothetical protein
MAELVDDPAMRGGSVIGGLSIATRGMQCGHRTRKWYQRTGQSELPSAPGAAVVEIARRGDWVEQQLTSTDLY